MLVSDIDGTMVGDVGCEGSGAFTSSGRFKEYWENAPVLSGSLLVYNTGESKTDSERKLYEQGAALRCAERLTACVQHQ